MSERKISEKIKEIRNSVVAIGFSPALNQITIIGSGFCISDDGKILTTAHIYTQTPPQSQAVLMAMAMVKQEANGLEHYTWLPLTFVKKVDNYDLALFQVNNYKETLLRPSELGNSDKVEVGQDVYFVGFPYAGQLINDGFGITLIVNRAMVSNIKQDGIDLAHARNWFRSQDVYFVGFPYAGQLINDGFGITLIVNRAMVSNIKQDGIDLAHARNWF